jgi:cyanate permease
VTGILHDIYGNYTAAFAIGIGVSGLCAVTIWLAAPGKVRAVAGQLHRSYAGTARGENAS